MHALSPIDLAAFKAAPLAAEPFEHVVLPHFVRAEVLPEIARDFPRVPHPGSVPLGIYRHGPALQALIDALAGPEMTRAVAEKFALDLEHAPRLVTMRARCRLSDGAIHTDTRAKRVSLLLYLNPGWEAEGGRLRLLRSGEDIEDYAVEIPAAGGTLLVFRRSERSFHGHKPFAGERWVLQINWMESAAAARREEQRHRFSAWAKRLLPVAS